MESSPDKTSISTKRANLQNVGIGWLADAVLATNICNSHSGLGFLDDRDDLRLAES